MHDSEKSDSGIVVTKPTNKAGRPVAEPVKAGDQGERGSAKHAPGAALHARCQARVRSARWPMRQAYSWMTRRSSRMSALYRSIWPASPDQLRARSRRA
jgi:RNA-directed DNA polymerase